VWRSQGSETQARRETVETVAEKQNSSRAPALPDGDAVSQPKRGQLVMFQPPKRRGRPRKPVADTPPTTKFEHTCAAIVGLAAGRDWPMLKERVLATARTDRRLSNAGKVTLGHLLEVINRNEGYDWRGMEEHAKACAQSVPTAERAFRRLRLAGYIDRSIAIITGKGRANKSGLTTIPALVEAAVMLGQERSRKAKEAAADASADGPVTKIPMDPSNNCDGPITKMPMVPSENCDGPISSDAMDPSFLTNGPIKSDGQTLIGNLYIEPSARQRARDDFQKPVLAEAAQPVRSSVPLPSPAAKRVPRFDKTLPLAQRIETWSLGEPADAKDAALYRRMRRFAKGWDCEVLKAQYVTWIVDAKKTVPDDPLLAFIGWIDSTAQNRKAAPGAPARTPALTPAAQEAAFEQQFGFEKGQEQLEAAWKAEDTADKTLKVEVWPDVGPRRMFRQPVGRWADVVLRRLKLGDKP
jgi:hypothetical protein